MLLMDSSVVFVLNRLPESHLVNLVSANIGGHPAYRIQKEGRGVCGVAGQSASLRTKTFL